ncbi:MAG: hypothetical protein L0H29_06815 [Sinobacteraceae bacterium]|nr:hypothetical protein [Nevskiaceae bacterium]
MDGAIPLSAEAESPLISVSAEAVGAASLDAWAADSSASLLLSADAAALSIPISAVLLEAGAASGVAAGAAAVPLAIEVFAAEEDAPGMGADGKDDNADSAIAGRDTDTPIPNTTTATSPEYLDIVLINVLTFVDNEFPLAQITLPVASTETSWVEPRIH